MVEPTATVDINGSDVTAFTFTVAPIWEMPFGMVVFTSVFLVANACVSLITNSLLIIIIYFSPNLKTPPNSHLVNICVNNLILSMSMIMATSMLLVEVNGTEVLNVLSGIHVFLICNCFLQYWGAFASIGYYRSHIIRHPSMTLKSRRLIVGRSLTCCWVVSLLVSLMACLAFVDKQSYACHAINPFRTAYQLCDDVDNISLHTISIVVIQVIVFLVGLVMIVTSYHGVFRTLNIAGTFGKNRVLPVTASFSLSSEMVDIPNVLSRSYTPNGLDCEKTTYAVPAEFKETVVHYQKNEHILTFEDIMALENPILASNLRRQGVPKRPLQLTRSTLSNASVKSRCPDFTDISPGADLQRYQHMKNSSALRNHFLRRDRVSLSKATKNSLIMLMTFVFFSMPMFLCTVPAVLSNVKQSHRILIILFCTIAFYLNAPVYPLWYLLYNNHVRKCMVRVYEGFLIRLHIRR